MTRTQTPERIGYYFVLASLVCSLLATGGWSAPVCLQEKLTVFQNKSLLVTLQSPAKRVSVVAPEIADVQVLDPMQLLVTGKTVGETNIVIWTEDGKNRMLDIEVQWNTAIIQETINRVLPEEAIEIVPMDNGIALKGFVRGIAQADQAMQVAQLFAPTVINMLHVPGLHQVLLKVKIAEVSRSFRDELGMDLHLGNGGAYGGSLLGKLSSGSLDTGELEVSEVTTMFFGLRNKNITAFMQALREKGLVNILAEPNLIARSGETASFLAGGEFPVPVVQGQASNSITIEYKEFGVRLNFTPTVEGNKKIHLDIAPEVSDLDFAQGLKLGGYDIPIIVTRKAHTVVKLDDGQTFAIAGLISRSKQNTKGKVPIAGDLPVMGQFFKNNKFNGQETELLILVTPHLVAPIQAEQSDSVISQSLDRIDRDGEGRGENGELRDTEYLSSSGKLISKPITTGPVAAGKEMP